MPNFNRDQRAAIEAENPDLLVSAAAGSGKTTVMVERIVQNLLRNPERHLNEMLVITFTREAARSMRRKLEESLTRAAGEGSREAVIALEEMESAQISTIHSFCRQVIAEGFHIVDIDSQVRVCEENESDRMFERSYYTAVERLLENSDGGQSGVERQLVRALMADFSQKRLLDSCRELYRVLMGIPEPMQHLEQAIERVTLPTEEHPWAQEVMSSVLLDLTGLDPLLARMEQSADRPDCPPAVSAGLVQDRAAVDSLNQALEELGPHPDIKHLKDLCRQTLDQMKTITARGLNAEQKEWYEGFKKLREQMKNKPRGILPRAIQNLEELENPLVPDDHRRIQRQLRGLEALLKQVMICFREEKQQANVMDFSDMEQLTYQLMTDEEHPEVRQSMTERYREIYVDECQDVSAIQDAIIQSLHSPGTSLFLVGDIKQSIYRFRHAEPGLFMHYRDTFLDEAQAEKRRIFFRDNYRSSEPVVDAVNAVFENSMDRSVNELDYETGDHLVANVTGRNEPVELLLVRKNAESPETRDMLEAQCRIVAERIRDLVSEQGGFMLRDICILMRSTSADAPKVVDMLKQMHIPCFYDGAQNYYGLTEVSAFLALLGVIDNIHQDTELITALKQVPFLFSDQDLAWIRMQAPGQGVPFAEAFLLCARRGSSDLDRRCKDVLDQVETWQLNASVMLPSDFIWSLMRETGYYMICGAYPDGRLRQGNLDTLYQKALDMQKRGILKLRDFLAEIHEITLRGGGDGDSPKAMGETDNEVRIMTMHKSKGLEFPVVFLMNLSRGLAGKDKVPGLYVDLSTAAGRNSLGVYMQAVNRHKHTKRDTYGKTAFSVRRKKDELSEQTRLLYVAMTRAMEKLCLVGTFTDDQVLQWREHGRKHRIWASASMLDLVMPAVDQALGAPDYREGMEMDSGPWKAKVYKPLAMVEEEIEKPDHEILLRIARAEASEGWKEMLDQWNTSRGTPQAVQTSVSSLVRNEKLHVRFVSDHDLTETMRQKSQPEPVMPNYVLDREATVPEFMAERTMDASEIGTANHHVLHLFDLARMKETDDLLMEILLQIREMVSDGRISQEESDAVNPDVMARFFSSDLGQRMLKADLIRREWPFLMRFENKGPTLIQGIVDVLFQEGDHLVILDYKTDHVTRANVMVPKHQSQLNWYRMAVEALTGLPVSAMYLVALRDGSCLEVPRIDP